MSVDRPLIRGLALVNSFHATKAIFGEPFMRGIVERLTPAQRAEHDAGFLPGRWYDEDIHARLCAGILAQRDEHACVQAGVGALKYHVSRGQKFLMRLAGPKRVMQRAQGLWSYWRDTGTSAVEHLDATSTRVAVLNHPLLATPGYAVMYAGASCYIIWLSGGRDVRMRVDASNPARVFCDVVWAPGAVSGTGWHSIDEAAASIPNL